MGGITTRQIAYFAVLFMNCRSTDVLRAINTSEKVLLAEMGIYRDNLSAIVIGDNLLPIIVIAQNSFSLLISDITLAICFVIADKLSR